MVLAGKLLQETVTHSKILPKKNLIKELFTKMLAGLKGFTRNHNANSGHYYSEHQGSSKNGKLTMFGSDGETERGWCAWNPGRGRTMENSISQKPESEASQQGGLGNVLCRGLPFGAKEGGERIWGWD